MTTISIINNALIRIFARRTGDYAEIVTERRDTPFGEWRQYASKLISASEANAALEVLNGANGCDKARQCEMRMK